MMGLEYVKLFGLGLLVLSSVQALNMEEVDEGSCRPLRSAPNLSMNWYNSVQNWYISGGSKLHLYSVTLHHLERNETALEEMPEYQFYYEACLTSDSMEPSGRIATTRGFEPGTGSLNRVTQGPGAGVIDYNRLTTNGSDAGEVSRHTITLTDNESFVFFTNCNLQTGKRSWDICTTQTVLSQSAYRRIEEHAIAQGFDKKHFVYMRYDSCKPGTVPVPNPNRPGGGGQQGQRGLGGGRSWVQQSGPSNVAVNPRGRGKWNKN